MLFIPMKIITYGYCLDQECGVTIHTNHTKKDRIKGRPFIMIGHGTEKTTRIFQATTLG